MKKISEHLKEMREYCEGLISAGHGLNEARSMTIDHWTKILENDAIGKPTEWHKYLAWEMFIKITAPKVY